MIAVISVLFISAITQVDAKTFDKEESEKLQGYGFTLRANSEDGQDRIHVVIQPIWDSKDLTIDLRYRVDGVELLSVDCIASKQILKVAGTQKVSLTFDTSDLRECSEEIPIESTITASVKIIGEPTSEVKDDLTDCSDRGEIQSCTRDHNVITSHAVNGEISGWDMTLVDQDGALREFKQKHSEWTQP